MSKTGENHSSVPIAHSISAKLLKVVFVIYLAVAVVVTSLHMAAEYAETRDSIMQELKILQRAFERGVATAVWYMDTSWLESVMRGILEHPMAIGVMIINDKGDYFLLGRTRYQEGGNRERFMHRRISDINMSGEFPKMIEHTFPLSHIAEDGEQYEVGTASLYSSNSVILNRLRLKLFLILLATIINMGAFWAIALFAGQRLLGRPLAIMADRARELNLDNLEQSRMHLGISERNELTLFEEAFNSMVQKLLTSREELQNLNLKLERRGNELELKFRDRTLELRESERRLAQIIEFLPDATFAIDAEGTVIAWNQAMEKLSGVKASNILGKGDYAYAEPILGRKQPVMIDLVIHFDEEVASRYQSLRREGDRLVSEIYLPDFGGRGLTWGWLVAAPLYDEAGRIVGAIESIRDISALKQAEEASRESREQFELFMDRLPHRVFIKDESSMVIYINQYVKDMFHGEHWLGKDAVDVFPDNPEVAEAMHADDQRALAKGHTTNEEAMPDKDGVEHVFQTTKFRIPRSGKSPLIGGIGLDITERVSAQEALRQSEERFKTLYREAKKTEELYHSLLDSTLDAIVTYDLEGRVIYVNPGFTKTFGWVKEELTQGVPYTPESEREITMANVNRVVREGIPIKDFETTRLTKQGNLIEVNISASRFNDHEGNSAGTLIILRDISEHKRAQKLLHQAKEAAEAATRAKSEFLANMSHEIRTPLNAILGLSHLALETPMTPQQLDYQQKVYASANSLLRLINDILDFSKIEAGKLDMEQRGFDLEQVLESMASVIRVKSAEKGLTFSVASAEPFPPRLLGDSLRLGQVLTNLASNAVKFTHEGEISVAVVPVETSEQDVTLRFVVRDTGIGMRREQIDHLFRPFHQADASITRKYGGTGLGLAISKRLVEMMGGEIQVRSTPGMGTEFSFTARFGKSKEKASARMHAVSKQQARELLSGSRLLLVEDNEINLQVAREFLEQVGIRVTVAVNGQQAVELAAKEPLDGILMDLSMPVLDGLSATREIRKGSAPADLPIIAMTANAMAGDREKCLSAGMNDHIAKPIDPARLYETLIRFIKPDAVVDFSKQAGTPEPVEPLDDFPDLDGVDVRTGLYHANGNRNLYLKVLKNVYRRYRDIAGQIQGEIGGGDINAALQLTHTFKGVAGTMGAKALHKRAQELEFVFENKTLDAIPDLMASFFIEVKQVMAALEQLFKDMDHPQSQAEADAVSFEAPDMERLKAVLGELSNLIDEGDSEALDLVGRIKDMLGQSKVTDDVHKLALQIDEYEFEDARETFKRISEALGMEA